MKCCQRFFRASIQLKTFPKSWAVLLMLRFVGERLHVHTGRCEVWGMQMSVVIVTGLTLSLIRDSGAEVVTGPGWETQRQGTGNRQQRHLSQPGRRNVGKWASIFGHFEVVEWSKSLDSVFSLHDVSEAIVVRPWLVLWWQCVAPESPGRDKQVK